jgi:hypothetical protein
MQHEYCDLKVGDRVIMIEDALFFDAFLKGTVLTISTIKDDTNTSCPYGLRNEERALVFYPYRHKYVRYVDRHVVGGDYYAG